jgi:hypothetical protein
MNGQSTAIAFTLMCYMQHRNDATLLLHATLLRFKLTPFDGSRHTVSVYIFYLKCKRDASRSGGHKTCSKIMQHGSFGSHPASFL